MVVGGWARAGGRGHHGKAAQAGTGPVLHSQEATAEQEGATDRRAHPLRGASPPCALTSDTKSDTSCRLLGWKASTAAVRSGSVTAYAAACSSLISGSGSAAAAAEAARGLGVVGERTAAAAAGLTVLRRGVRPPERGVALADRGVAPGVGVPPRRAEPGGAPPAASSARTASQATVAATTPVPRDSSLNRVMTRGSRRIASSGEGLTPRLFLRGRGTDRFGGLNFGGTSGRRGVALGAGGATYTATGGRTGVGRGGEEGACQASACMQAGGTGPGEQQPVPPPLPATPMLHGHSPSGSEGTGGMRRARLISWCTPSRTAAPVDSTCMPCRPSDATSWRTVASRAACASPSGGGSSESQASRSTSSAAAASAVGAALRATSPSRASTRGYWSLQGGRGWDGQHQRQGLG